MILFAKHDVEDLFWDNYQEFLELFIIFLGNVPPRVVGFRHPGLYYLDKWITKAIYSLNLFILKHQFT